MDRERLNIGLYLDPPGPEWQSQSVVVRIVERGASRRELPLHAKGRPEDFDPPRAPECCQLWNSETIPENPCGQTKRNLAAAIVPAVARKSAYLRALPFPIAEIPPDLQPDIGVRILSDNGSVRRVNQMTWRAGYLRCLVRKCG